jgi:hypothetical protein
MTQLICRTLASDSTDGHSGSDSQKLEPLPLLFSGFSALAIPLVTEFLACMKELATTSPTLSELLHHSKHTLRSLELQDRRITSLLVTWHKNTWLVSISFSRPLHAFGHQR